MHAWLSAVQQSMTTEAVNADTIETHSATEPLVLFFLQLFNFRLVTFVMIIVMASVQSNLAKGCRTASW